jgi:hypothetical protein
MAIGGIVIGPIYIYVSKETVQNLRSLYRLGIPYFALDFRYECALNSLRIKISPPIKIYCRGRDQ